MAEFVAWNSRDLEEWSAQHAAGKIIELAGRRTHYRQAGSGAPLILLHGFYYDSYLWAENIPALADHYTVYAPDLWGFGYSTREPLDYGYPLFAEQVRLFMDELGLERASLMGQSMGGGTAIHFTVTHPDRVEKLVLVDPAALPNPLPWKSRIFNLPGIGEFLSGLNTDLVRRRTLAEFWIHDRSRLTDSYFTEATRFQKIRGTTEVLHTILRRRFFDTLERDVEALDGLGIPVLIAWGKHDRAVPLACGEKMHRLLAGSRFEIFDDSGHLPNYEEAEAFNRLVLAFLQTPGSGPGPVSGTGSGSETRSGTG